MPVNTSMSSADQAMQTLTAQWYNTLTTGLGLDPGQFQLYQGNVTLANDSVKLWNVINAVPPFSINNYNNPQQVNNFQPNYNTLLSDLVVPSSYNAFANCMGADAMKSWLKYAQHRNLDLTSISAANLKKAFTAWSNIYNPEKINCLPTYQQSRLEPLSIALNMTAQDGQAAWTEGINDVTAALDTGATKTISFNSLTASSNTQHTWAGGSVGVFFGFFGFGGGGSYDHLTTQATSAGINVEATFNKVATVPIAPYQSLDVQDSDLANYLPWFYGPALGEAFKDSTNNMWQNPANTHANWDFFFGTNGILQRMATAIVVAEDITIRITSSAQYSVSDQQTIHGMACGGMWPFFAACGGYGSATSSVTFDAGGLTIITTIPQGVQILGILQTPMSTIFGG